jgi:mannan endo-1,6-alpha-mannosidase
MYVEAIAYDTTNKVQAYLDFWRYTGNTTFNSVAKASLLWQVGANRDFLPANFSTSAGNDDQAFWGMAAMSAAEYNFSNPTDKEPQWLALAQAVFNEQADRWDMANCGGGLRWQVFQYNQGYSYKNSISNGAFFNIAARLARYTGNSTYGDWAEKVWQFQLASGFMNSSTLAIYDGGTVPTCKPINQIQWTYNNALFMGGCAFMYNLTNNASWLERTDRLITRMTEDFFGGANQNILYEPACEPYDTCNVDQHSFKGYLARNMGYTMIMYPASRGRLLPLLASSAKAAAKACTGTYAGMGNNACGFKWTWDNGTFDGSTAVGFLVGQQLSTMETIQANLAIFAPPPFTNATGGTSKGDVAAGTSGDSRAAAGIKVIKPATTADRAGAWILTTLFTALTFVFAWWVAF